MITTNPLKVTNSGGAPQMHQQGVQQGAIVLSPYADSGLKQGIVAETDTLPSHAGIPIKLMIKTGMMTNRVARSVAGDLAAAITGFSTSHSMGTQGWTWQDSQAPTNLQGSGISYFEFGSDVQMYLPIDPTLAATLTTGTLASSIVLGWDYVNGRLHTEAVANLQLPIRIAEVFLPGDGIGKYKNSTYVQDPVTGNVNFNTQSVAVALVTL